MTSTQRTLVVCYSRTGTTRKVADAIARALDNAECEQLQDTVNRAGLGGYLRSAMDGIFGRRTVLTGTRRDPRAYDLVVVGTPVWFGALSSPARTYLEENAGRFPAVAFFLTHGGTGRDKVFAQMQRASGARPLALLSVRAADAARGAFGPGVATFVKELDHTHAAAPPTPGTNAAAH